MKNKALITSSLSIALLIIVFAWSNVSKAQTYSSFGQVSGQFINQMEIGSTGPEVTKLQTFLAGNPAIYPEGLVTGYFGPLTESAVKRFQATYGISTVGRVGPITLTQLNSIVAGSGTVISGDTHAPILSGVVLNRTAGTASIQWNTNEATSKNKIFYSNTPLIFYETSAPRTEPYISGISISENPSNQSNFHNIGLVNLSPGTTYYYMIESVDQSGNVSVTWPSSFVAL